jgi:hypothetical protein
MAAYYFRQILIGAACACSLSLGSSVAQANIIYNIALPPTGDLSASGTLTTDGSLGLLTLANVVDWDITVFSASLSYGFNFLSRPHGPPPAGPPGPPYNSTLRLDSAIATDTTLFLPYPSVFDLESVLVCGQRCGQVVVTPAPPGGNVEYFRTCTAAQVCDVVEIGLPLSGVQLANGGVEVAPPSAVPSPASLPLFAAGLGVTAWMARRKKRKAAAEA